MPSTHTHQDPTPPSAAANTPQRITLAEYHTETGEQRLLIGERIDGTPRLVDEPAGSDGTPYVVEPQVDESNAALQALIADYVAKAEALGYPPMHGWF